MFLVKKSKYLIIPRIGIEFILIMCDACICF